MPTLYSCPSSVADNNGYGLKDFAILEAGLGGNARAERGRGCSMASERLAVSGSSRAVRIVGNTWAAREAD